MDSFGNLAETKFAKTIPHFSCFRLRFRLIWPALLVEMHLLPAESCGISGISSRFPIVRLPCSPFGFPTRARAFSFWPSIWGALWSFFAAWQWHKSLNTNTYRGVRPLSELQGLLFIRAGAKNKWWQTGRRAPTAEPTYFRLPTHWSLPLDLQSKLVVAKTKPKTGPG